MNINPIFKVPDREKIFMDAEFMELSAVGTTLLSIGLIKENGEQLYLEFKQPEVKDD